VHASASPFEATAERMNWTGQSLATDPFGRAMLLADIPEPLLRKWMVDAQVKIPGTTSSSSIFDHLEDTNASECLEKLVNVTQE
jgi:hypothetical protein